MGYSIQNCIKGSSIAGKWIDDAKKNKQSVDIVMVGDSNCHYGEPATQGSVDFGARIFGLADGLTKALMDEGLNLYGSPIYPVAIGSNTFKTGVGTWLYSIDNRDQDASVGSGNIRLRNTAGTLTAGYLGSVYNVSNAAFSSLADNFTYFYNEMSQAKLATATGSIKTGFYSHDPSAASAPAATNWFMFTANSTGAMRNDQFVIDGNPWFTAAKWDDSLLYFRMTHSSTPNGGSITLGITRNSGAGATNAGAANLTFAAKNVGETSYTFKDSELAFNKLPNSPTSSNLVAADGVKIYFSGNTTIGSTVTAPIAAFFISIYEKKIGFAVSQLQAEGQCLPEDTINKFIEVNDAGNYLKQFFSAIVRRQVAANSNNQGRVIVVMQHGTNTNATQGGVSASTNSTDATERVKKSLVSSITVLYNKWIASGFAPGNIAFVIMGGPVTSNSFSDDISKKLYETTGSQTITVIDHVKALPRTDYVSGLYWDGGNTTGTGSGTAATHLSEAGYVEWGKTIVKNLLQYNINNRIKKK